jgi:hypothetical protein
MSNLFDLLIEVLKGLGEYFEWRHLKKQYRRCVHSIGDAKSAAADLVWLRHAVSPWFLGCTWVAD